MELVNTNSLCWAVVLEPGGNVCAMVESGLGAGLTQRNHVKTGLENQTCAGFFLKSWEWTWELSAVYFYK